MKKFFKNVISSKDSSSAKRFVTLVMSALFIFTQLGIMFLIGYMVFYIPKGKLEPHLLDLMKDILEYNMWIIMSGLGFVAVENMGQYMVERVKAKMGLSSNVEVKKPEEEDGH